jgi:hypothetical protein
MKQPEFASGIVTLSSKFPVLPTIFFFSCRSCKPADALNLWGLQLLSDKIQISQICI